MQRNRLFFIQALGEIISFQNLFDGNVRCQSYEAIRTELVHPLRIETHLGLHRIKQLENLSLVSFRVGIDLFASKLRPGRRIAGRIADQSGEIADKKNDCVAQLLKSTQLANDNGVSKMNVRRGGIDPEFYAQWLACLRRLFKLGAQLLLADDLRGSFAQVLELFINRHWLIVNRQA